MGQNIYFCFYKILIVTKESRDIPQISEIGFYKASEEETAKE